MAGPTVQISDDKKYGKAIGLLLEMGGIFRTKPMRQLVIGPAQLQALQGAGLVPKANGARKRGEKEASPSSLPAEMEALNQTIREDLSLPSLRDQPPRVQGYAYRFLPVLPLLTSEGNRVFTDEHLSQLFRLFNMRFGGCLASSSRSGVPFFGEYLPEGIKPVRDYHTIVIAYAYPIEPSGRFFQQLKSLLRKAPLIEQDEILIERSEVYLV